MHWGVIAWYWLHCVSNRSPREQLTHWGRDKICRYFADDIFKCIFLNANVWIPIQISLKFAPQGPINNIPALVQIMAWRRPGDKLLSEPMIVIRPQWVNEAGVSFNIFRCIGIRSHSVSNMRGWVKYSYRLKFGKRLGTSAGLLNRGQIWAIEVL